MSLQIEIDLGGLLPIAEKRKLLNHFIIKAEKSQVNNILKDCEGLPTNLYHLLKLLLADKFRRFDLIIELLYDGDSSIISGATSKQWLYEGEDTLFTDRDFLINKLFPNVSYNCRQKMVYRIGRFMQNEEKADKLWTAVEEKYGFHICFPLLPACSKDKIKSVLANRKVDLSGYQLVQILQKYPEVGLQYLKDHFTNIGKSSTDSYRSPLAYLYKNHLDDFLDLCINHSDKINSFKFGNSRSTKIIRAYREKLLEKPAETSALLKIDRIRREFSTEEFQTFFESSLDTPADFNNKNVWKWVNTVPVNKRVDMVNRAYMKVFQINLNEQYEFMYPEHIVLLPDDKRLAVVQWKSENPNYSWSFKDIDVYFYKEKERKHAWLPLKPTSHSVPELQKLLLIEQDVACRSILSKYLIQTCYINDDLPQLLNVLVLLNKRCRNDQSEVRRAIFHTLGTIINRMEFSKEHWDVIIEMIQVSQIVVDIQDYTDSEKDKLVEKCIAFHLASRLPLNNLVSMHIKLKMKTTSNTWTNSYIKSETDRRSLLQMYVKELENLQLANDLRSHDGQVLESERWSEFIANLIEEIRKFNKRASKASPKLEPISIASHQWLRNSLEKIAKEDEDRVDKNSKLSNSLYSWSFSKQLVNIILALRQEQSITSDDAFNDSKSLLSKILHFSPCSSILTYLLGKNPTHLVKNWPTTLSKMLKRESALEFIRMLKLWNYSTLTVQAIKTCTEIIGQTFDHNSEITTILQKCNAVAVLSVLSEPADYLALAEKFYPTEKNVDVFADNSKEEYRIRQAIAKCLKNVAVSHLTFPAIEKFCVGDYLKFAVSALYSHSVRASEAKTLNFLRPKLVNSPVSLQKHIIRQYFAISSVEERIHAFKEINSSNVTIRFEMFLRASQLFRSSTSQETWTILKNSMEKASSEDASLIKYLHSTPKLDTCPMQYISDYITTCVTLLSKVKSEKIDNFMSHLESIMNKIPEKTLDDIILHKNVEQTSFSSTFCVKYLKSSASESVAEHRLSNMWLLLQNVARNGWNVKAAPRLSLRSSRRPYTYSLNTCDYPTRTSIFGFVANLCHDQMGDACKARLKGQIFQSLLDKFQAESVTKYFKEILYLQFALLLVKVVEKSGIERIRAFGQSLARLTDSLVNKYGGEIILFVKEVFSDYVQVWFSDEFSQNMGVIVELIDGILETSKTRANQIISISLLRNTTTPKSRNLMATWEKINNVLKESNDVIAQMYYGLNSVIHTSDPR